MPRSTVLIVEDNLIARERIALALRTAGHHVLEAGDGEGALVCAARTTPDVVIVAANLPDRPGAVVVERLRAMAALATVPVIGLTSFNAPEEQHLLAAGVNAIVVKPVDADLLVTTVAGLVPLARSRDAHATGRVVVAADDDPTQLKLLRVRLEALGFKVHAAADGVSALALAREHRPSAIVSDALMPEMDGFALCSAVRRDPELARTPVILATSSYVEQADRELADAVGATAYTLRTPGMEEVIATLLEHVQDGAPAARPSRGEPLEARQDDHLQRVIRQLERQAAVTVGLVQRCALQGAELSVLSGIAEALSRREDVDASLEPILCQCLDASGLTQGELHLVTADGTLALRARVPAGASSAAPEELARALAADGPTSVSLAAARSGLALPLVDRGERTGLLVLGSGTDDLTGADWQAFARTVASQLGLAVALTKAFGRLSSSELRHRALMEHANDAILVLDLTGRVLDANCQTEASMRRARSQLARRPWTELVAPPSRAAATASLLAAIDKGMARLDGLLLDTPGEPRAFDVSLALVDTGTERVVLAIARDVSERQRAQQSLARTAERLMQSQKMEAVGRLAGGVAHDFNNLLTAILGYAEVLQGGARDEATRTVVEEIQKAGTRAAALTRQLLAISRKQVVQPKALDLNAVVADMDRLLRRVISTNVELVSRPAHGLWAIVADASQLEQVILNLAVNARDAMAETGGRLLIETRNVQVKEEGPDEPPIPPGDYVLLAVTDTGCGMPPEVAAKAFEPFFTTKRPGDGTGLGLSTVYGVIRQANGYILADSAVGRGTTMRCWWPRSASEADSTAPIQRPAPVGGSETILLVEDDDLVRRLVERTLVGHGYKVLVAREPKAALTLATSGGGPIHLLVTDVMMPGMNGHELARRVQAGSPRTRVLFLSGYQSGAMPLGVPQDESGAFLRKPFDGSTLACAVRDVLDAGPGGPDFIR